MFADDDVGIVEAPLSRVAGVALIALAEGDLHAMPPLEPAAAFLELGSGVLQFEAWEDGNANLAAPLDHLPHLIGAHVMGVLDHAHNPPVDEVLPHFLFLSHHSPDLGLVKEDIAVAETEGQHVHAGADELVDGPPQLVPVQRGIEPLGVVVVRVAVVDEAGRGIHGRSVAVSTYVGRRGV